MNRRGARRREPDFREAGLPTGAGVPNDGVRDIPDVALIASPQSPGVFCAHDENGSAQVECCIGGAILSAPVWAGFSRVLQQITGGSRLGNLNPVIYKLAAAARYLTGAAPAGNPIAATRLAIMYETADGVPKDLTRAFSYYQAAATAGE